MAPVKDLEPEAVETPEEVPEPVEPTPDEEEEEAAETEPEPPPAPVEEPATEGEQNRALASGLKRERELHAKRLSNILGDAAAETMPCPLCFDGLMGYLHPGSALELTDEARENALAFLGARGKRRLRPAEGVVMCDRCDGEGALEYPTKVEHVVEQTCPKCSGNGYIPEGQTAGTHIEHAITQLPGTCAVVNGANACPICGTAGMAGQPHYCQPPV